MLLLRSVRMKPYFELKKLKFDLGNLHGVYKRSFEPEFDPRLLQSISLARRVLSRLVAYKRYLRAAMARETKVIFIFQYMYKVTTDKFNSLNPIYRNFLFLCSGNFAHENLSGFLILRNDEMQRIIDTSIVLNL